MRLEAPDKNGVTRREHAEQLARQLNIEPEEAVVRMGLEEPEVPPEALHTWDMFWELSAGRTSNGFGPNPLGFEILHSYTTLIGLTPTPWAVRTLRAMDNAYLNAQPRPDTTS